MSLSFRKYNLKKGAQKIKTNTTSMFTGVIIATMGLAMTVAVPLGAKAAVGGPTCNVGTDYPTIQAAVSVPTCTVVNVPVGVYPENVVINHSLTLNGAQAGNNARNRTGTESVINGTAGPTITVNADNVTVDGFTLDGNLGSGVIVMLGANTGETVQNNIINNPGAAAYFNTNNTMFKQNVVNNTATSTDGFQANSTPLANLTILSNSFRGANPVPYNADVTVIEGSSNVTATGNMSNGDGTFIALFKTDGAHITGNTVVGGGNSSAIYIGGGDSNVTVSGNQVSSAGAAVKVTNYANQIGINSNVTVTQNVLNANQYGLYVTGPGVATATTVTAHQNNLSGNTLFGIDNEATGTLSGTCNWWGAANGPGPVGSGSGSNVSSGVAFAPWLVTSNLNGACVGGNIVMNKDQCKNDGWKDFTDTNNRQFKNQGDCVSFVATNGKNQAAGLPTF